MSLISTIDRLFHVNHFHLPARKPTPPARPAAAADGFEVAAKSPVNLGQLPPASSAADATFVTGLYRDLLHREPDAAGLASHLRGLQAGMSRDEIKNVFLTSPEFRQLQAAAQATPAAAPAAPAANNFGDATKLGPVPLEGFDAGKLSNPAHTSVKYLFGRVATHFPLDSVKDKAGAEALLNKMVPELRAAGLDIQGVKGDRLLMKTPLGLESIDVVRGAGSGNPGWWWGADGTVASPEEIAKFPPLSASPVTPPPAPTGTPSEPGAPLSTVPPSPEYASAPIDKSSPSAAILSAARWARASFPDLFTKAMANDASGRQACFDVMTKVIGALRAAGFDATRVVNHTDRPVGDGYRYGTDAVALNGRVYDAYRDMGAASIPQAADVGEYAAGRSRE